jgi:hypothetical protein
VVKIKVTEARFGRWFVVEFNPDMTFKMLYKWDDWTAIPVDERPRLVSHYTAKDAVDAYMQAMRDKR